MRRGTYDVVRQLIDTKLVTLEGDGTVVKPGTREALADLMQFIEYQEGPARRAAITAAAGAAPSGEE